MTAIYLFKFIPLRNKLMNLKYHRRIVKGIHASIYAEGNYQLKWNNFLKNEGKVVKQYKTHLGNRNRQRKKEKL